MSYIYIVFKNDNLISANTKKYIMMSNNKDMIVNDADIKVVRVNENYDGANNMKTITDEVREELKVLYHS